MQCERLTAGNGTIEGWSLDEVHTDVIEVSRLSLGNPGKSNDSTVVYRGGANKVVVQDFYFNGKLSLASSRCSTRLVLRAIPSPVVANGNVEDSQVLHYEEILRWRVTSC